MLPSLCLLSSTGPRDSNHGTSRRTYAPGGGECALPAAPSLSPPSAAGGCLSLFFALLAVSYESRTPPSLWSPSHTRHQPRPRSHAARLGFRCRRSARRSSRRHPPSRLKKNSILSYCSACAVALPGECPLGTRFLNRFYIRWHIAQAPGQKFTSNRIRPSPTSSTPFTSC